MTFPRYFIFLTTLALILLQSCATLKKSSQEDLPYFEGQVNYELNYEFLTENSEFREMVLSAAPNKSTLLYKNGNYFKHYYRNDTLINTTLFLADPCMIYYISLDSDTVAYISMKTTDVNTDMVKYDTGETILGYTTSSISSLMTGKKGSEVEGLQIKQVYHNCMDLPINPEHFKDFIQGRYNEFVKKYPGISLQNELIYFNAYKETETAIKIEQKPIEVSFELDSTKVYVPLKM